MAYFLVHIGTFYGNPSESWPTTAYKIWANNSCCSTVGFINITVVNNITEDHVHYPGNLTLINNTDNDNLPFIPNLYSPLGNKIGNFYDTDTELWEADQEKLFQLEKAYYS